jgi:2Fe-2S ferredoxin
MKMTFILKNGEERTVSFALHQTVLAVAEENHIPIGSTCEGFGVCGKCHIIVENLLDKLPEVSDSEEDTLDKVSGVSEWSRLACQLILEDSLDGLRVRLA